MAFQGDSIFWVETNKIVANPYQPRREFDENKLKELAESIRMYGVLQPLTVTKKEIQTEDGAFYSEYELIAGERRWRASKLASLEQVPVIIRDGNDTEQEKLELAIIENLQREDLNAVDRALAFRQLADTFELSHSQVAKKVGRSREYVSNSIRLLMLPEYMLNSIKTGDISEGHARSLLMLKERPEEQDVVYREILMKKLSVREVERIARKIASDKVRKKNWVNTDPALIEIEREFTDSLGTRVQISKTDFGGKLTIDYFSEDDLQNLLAIVKSQGRISQKVEASEDTDANDVGPVMQAAGAAVLAKLAQATPLETVEEAKPTVVEPESFDHAHSTPAMHEPEESIASGVVGEARETEQKQAQVAPPEEESTDISPKDGSLAVSEPQVPVERSPEPETSEAQPPALEQASPSWSFSFRRPETPAASEPEAKQPAEETPEPTASEPVVPPASEQSPVESASQDVIDTPPASPTSSPQTPAPVEPAPKEEKEDDNLYSIRNFTL